MSVKTQNELALASVKVIYDAANEAQAEAERAHSAADDAAAAASAAQTQAGNAATAASNAQTAAENASKTASAALDQLGIVEDVIGVLTWASEHGTFALTADTTVQDGKVYFTYDSSTGDYVPVVSPASNPHAAGYYELSVDEAMDSFIMSHLAVTSRGLWVLPNGMGSASDAQYAPNYKVLLSNNGMYVYDGSGALVSTFGENITFSATRAQKIGGANNYIEFDPTTGYINIVGDGVYFGSMAVGNIATHEEAEALGAIADELDARLEGVETQQADFEQTTAENLESIRGLQTAFEDEALDAIKALQNSQADFALMSDLTALQTFINEYLGTDGYITAVNSGSNPYLEIGKAIGSSSFFVRISSTEMGFYQNGKRVAYINSSQLYITNSEVLNEQRVGDFLWRVNGTNRMSLVYSPKTT